MTAILPAKTHLRSCPSTAPSSRTSQRPPCPLEPRDSSASSASSAPAVFSAAAALLGCRDRRRAHVRRAAVGRRQLGVASAGASLVPASARAETEKAKEFYGGSLTYPDWLLGDWKVSSELVSVEAPKGDEFLPEAAVKARARVGKREAVVEYVKRYVRQGDRIVNDRAYTSRPLLASLGFDGPAESAEWGGADNPDVALLKLQRGSFAVRLNLRSMLKAGVQPEGRTDLFNVSELFFAATEQPPEVIPSREVTKFKRVDELPGRPGVPGVQELLRVEVYQTLAGEAGGQAMQEQAAGLDLQTPVAIYKYRAVLLPAVSKG